MNSVVVRMVYVPDASASDPNKKKKQKQPKKPFLITFSFIFDTFGFMHDYVRRTGGLLKDYVFPLILGYFQL